MFEILTYPFFRYALIGVILISVAAAIIGTYIVSRRMVSISGGITHACFGGLGLGYYLGMSPILCASLFAIASSAGVEFMSRRQRIREDSAIAIIWALGMAVGIIFVFLTPGYVPELNTFLFGNVLTISRADLWTFAIFTAILILFFLSFHRNILACAFDNDFARVMHRPVRFINYSMTVLIAVCIVLTIRLVGVMLLMSMLVLPQIIAEIYCRRFYAIMIASIVISLICSIAGLMISSMVNVPCSALIVAMMVGAYIVAQIVNVILSCLTRRSAMISILFVLLLSSGGCSLKKNTAASRQYTAFITRYNIYFNGDEHYKQTLKDMENKYEDDYSQLLYMHPAEAFANDKAPQPSADFKRSIEKGQKAIQLRSIKKRPARKAGKSKDPEYKKWLQREEYNPFLHNAWMMMARSQYFGGDFLGAASTFFYISKHFWWLPNTVTEAKLWQARSYVAIDWLFEAETLLNSVKEKDIEGNSTLTNLYDFTKADLLVRSKKYEEAVPWLKKTISHSSGSQKARLTFLLGQVCERIGDKDGAYKAFKQVGGMGGASYRTKFNARIKQSEVFQGQDIKSEVKALKSLTRYDANKAYLDQIYYAIGNLYLSRADTTQAIDNYVKAVSSSTRNGIDKALAQVALGQLYFDQHLYEKAQPCYAEAVPVIPDNYPGYDALRRRSDVLDELAIYSQNVTTQDSLLKLSYLSRDEQLKVIDKIITDLKKREKEEAENAAREQYLQDQAAAGNGLQQGSSDAPTTFALNTDKSWYFYNTATRNAGRTEFQKRWGSRKLEDDWRRRNKTVSSFSFGDDAETETDGDNPSDDLSIPADSIPADAETQQRASDPHYPEYYLQQIPSTDAERATANDVIQEGLYNMGIILKDKLEDFSAAEGEFTRLLTRYPDNEYRLDVYYNMYLMYMRSGDLAKAEVYRDLIIKDFPDSKYGEALLDPNYMDKLLRMPQIEQQLYDDAFKAYMANDNAAVHRIYSTMRADYPMSRIMPKFMFIEALSYVTEGNPEKFSETLSQLIERYPDTDVTPLATDYLKQLQQGRQLNNRGSNLRGFTWSTRLSADSTATASPDGAAAFDFDNDGPHVLALIFPSKTVSANQLLFEVARHNFSAFMVKDFDLELLRFGQLDIIVVSGFANQREVVVYRNKLESGDFHLPAGVIPLIISQHNLDILTSQGRTLEEYFEAADDRRIDQLHQSLTGAESTVDDTPAIDTPAPTQTALPEPQPETKPETKPQATPETPVTVEPIPSPDAPAQQPAEPQPQEPTTVDPDEYDIPIPLVPVGTPPVAPRIK